jgi:hypothetical protein
MALWRRAIQNREWVNCRWVTKSGANEDGGPDAMTNRLEPMSPGYFCLLAMVPILIGTSAAAAAGEDAARTGPVEVRIELPKASYALGDTITFVVTANRDCYFLVFTIDPNDKVEIHDPVASGPYMGHPLLKAGERREIPVPDAPGRAVVTPPAGTYEIGAVCGREELAKFGLSQIELKEPAKAGRRSFEFHLGEKINHVDRNALSQTTIAYDVKAP